MDHRAAKNECIDRARYGVPCAAAAVAAIIGACGGVTDAPQAQDHMPPLAVNGGGNALNRSIALRDGAAGFHAEANTVTLQIALADWPNACRESLGLDGTLLVATLRHLDAFRFSPGSESSYFLPGDYAFDTPMGAVSYDGAIYAGTYCSGRADEQAKAGLVRLTYVSPTNVAGSISMYFDSGEVHGDFSVAVCSNARCPQGG